MKTYRRFERQSHRTFIPNQKMYVSSANAAIAQAAKLMKSARR